MLYERWLYIQEHFSYDEFIKQLKIPTPEEQKRQDINVDEMLNDLKNIKKFKVKKENLS